MGEITVKGPAEGSYERIERFQALSAGQYWRAREAIPEEGIEAGTVLLLQSIRLVDDTPHTIILRPHPTKMGESYEVTTTGADGNTRTRWVRYHEHRFLLNDFLRRFEFEPDAQRVRAQEADEVQQRIRALQAELVETPRNPLLMAPVIEAGLKEDAEEAARKAQAQRYYDSSDETDEEASPTEAPADALPVAISSPRAEVVQLARGSVSQALASGVTPHMIEELKTAATREHQIATIKARWITGKTKEIAETIAALTPFYEEQAAAALAQTEDVRTYVDKLLSGIASLDLYVGKGVEVQTLRTGVSAAADLPLTLVQRKLLMDEELAVWADVDEHFDFSRESRFFEALLEHPGLVHQIFPTERCVLVMATTHRAIDYGDPWVNLAKNDRNKAVFLLVRDGENLYRIFSPVESHLGAANLFPSEDEQDSIFRGLDGRHIKFEDIAYTDKLSVHEKFALHYKRFLLLLCGLDHRLKLFGEFYPGPASFDFVSMEFQERYMRFLFDGGGRTLGLDVMPLRKWIEEKNRYLRSGSRVLCHWHAIMNPTTAPGACRRDNSRRSSGFYRRYHPKKNYEVAIVYKDGEDLCVDVTVTGESRRSYEERTFQCKVYLSRIDRSRYDYDLGTLPFLVLDAVDPDELTPYILRRESRTDHLFYIRFFKTAVKYLAAEASREAAARAALSAALSEGRIASGAEARELINRAVRAWRAANNGADLPAPTALDSRAWKSLLDQLYQLAGAADSQAEVLAQYVRAQGLEPLRLVLSGKAKFWMYATPAAAERDDRLEPHAFVHRIVLERTARGVVRERGRTWVSLPERSASETTVKEWPAAADWIKLSSFFATFEDKQAMLGSVEGAAERLAALAGPVSPQRWQQLFSAWKSVREKLLLGRYVSNPEFALPFGLLCCRGHTRLRYLAIGSRQAHALLHRMAPDEATRLALRAEFIRPYANKRNANAQFDQAVNATLIPQLRVIHPKFRKLALEGFYSDEQLESGDCSGESRFDPRLNPWWQRFLAGAKEREDEIYLASDSGPAADLDLDQLLNVQLPADFEAVQISEYRLHAREGDLPKLRHWFDLAHEGAKAPAMPENYGYSSSTHIEFTREKARIYIHEHVKDLTGEGAQLLRDCDIPEAPPTPAGVLERWYLLAPES